MGRFNLKKMSVLVCLIVFTLFSMRLYNNRVSLLQRENLLQPQIKALSSKERIHLFHKPNSNHSAYISFDEQIKLKIDDSVLKFKCGVDGIVTVKSGGRLGNQMGEYATLLAIALRDDFFPVLQHRTHTTLTKYFQNISIPSIRNFKCPLKWNYMNLRAYNQLNKTEKARLAREGIFIDGYPTSVSMFHRHRPLVQRQFTFKNDLVESAERELRKLRGISRSDVTYIGVHVRRTDYRDFLLGRYNGHLVGENYFKRAMDYFRQRYPKRLFVVASDDMDWCQDHLKPVDGDLAFAGNRNAASPAADMALLASCNHSIITYGNFGFWSAYLAGGETILSANISETPTDLQRSILAAKIDRWQFFPEFS